MGRSERGGERREFRKDHNLFVRFFFFFFDPIGRGVQDRLDPRGVIVFRRSPSRNIKERRMKIKKRTQVDRIVRLVKGEEGQKGAGVAGQDQQEGMIRTVLYGAMLGAGSVMPARRQAGI